MKLVKKLLKRGLSLLSTRAAVYGYIVLFSASSALVAPTLHESFLRYSVGQVVIKIVRDNKAVSGGTGLHVKTPSGATYILTNKHVATLNGGKVGDTVLVVSPDGKRQMLRRIIDISDEADLALVEGMPGMKGVSLAGSYEIGQQIAIVGHPLLNALTISRGQIISKKEIELLDGTNVAKEECESRSKKHKHLELDDSNPAKAFLGIDNVCLIVYLSVETNAFTYPGNSGSGVVNFYGHLVGLIFAGNSRSNWGYFVALEDVTNFLSVY